MSTSAVARFWQTDLIREAFLDHATQDDLCALRLVSHDFADVVAFRLFNTVTVNFDINSFSRRPRMLALDRIGQYVKTFHFNLPHSEATFLPPLIDPETLEEITFQYEPQSPASRPSSSSSSCSDSFGCKYGSWEMNDLLVRQYPPLFHAAANVTSFIRALNALPYLRHIRISCPDQPAGQKYRRDAVDYALISLRLAIESTNLPFLDIFSLDPIHPSATFYLRPHNGIGTSPASTRVWHRITTVNITMDNFNCTEEDTTDHLKILHTYLQNFRSMEKLSFSWNGERGPCPLSLDAEPCTSRPSFLDCSTACPVSSTMPACRPIKFRKLKSMRLQNAILDASQASRFIAMHRKVLRDFEFEQCVLRSGTWDEALEPLERMRAYSDEEWRSHKSTSSVDSTQYFEVMDVPIVYSPVEEVANPMECVREQLWSPEDRDVKRVINEVFKHVAGRSPRKRDVVACGIRTFLRSMGGRWH